ncbi:MAG: cysteine--tRNA ligase [Clostridiales bacterium]|nr:cysteine--tRNA ligase [Candidatus Scatonaster coprocaballi]
MKIFNTMTRMKEEFVPMEEGKVKMYACGPTVYNYFHLGNARPFVTFDTLRRYLEYRGYEVTFCQNFTDIDDKMINRANQEGITIKELADRYIAEYYKDADALGIKRPTFQPRATETMDEIIALISDLVEKGYAYQIEDGVYYDVTKFKDYGKLSHYNLEDLQAGGGERGASYEGKKNPADFAIWKAKKEGEPFWSSPWGDGRPGWHIECSAMNRKYLGKTIDIHGGGQDLIFPHHENEIAQSEAANGCTFSRYWMHNAFVNVDNEKMSKSLGNFFTVRDIVEKFPYEVIRFFILSGHYRMPINFSDELLKSAQNGLDRISTAVETSDFLLNHQEEAGLVPNADASAELSGAVSEAKASFIANMDDDMNTADAITSVYSLVRVLNTHLTAKDVSAADIKVAADMICELMNVLGLDIRAILNKDSGIPSEVMDLVNQRVEAKKNKDFARADALRDQVSEMGYQIKDTPQGPQVTKK